MITIIIIIIIIIITSEDHTVAATVTMYLHVSLYAVIVVTRRLQIDVFC